MDARKHLIIIKGKDQTDSVSSFQFHDGKCEVVYTSAPNKSYSFQRSNVEILPLQKKIDPAQVIVTANGQTISEIDEILDFGGYYRIVRNGKRDLSFRRSEVQFQQNCLTDGKNQETFQYFKETAAAISLVAENGINILSMQYDKIQQVSEDTVLASYLAPQKDVKMPQMPEAVIYPFGLNQSQKLAVERALSSKISIIQGPPGTGKTQTILNIIANVVRSGKTVAVVSNNNSATHNVVEKLEKKNAAFLTAFLGSLANKEKFLDAQTGAYPNMSDWEMPPEERQQLDQETTALSKELNEMLNAKNRIAEIEQEFLQLNPEQHYFEEYYASYSDVPMESLDKLSSQKLLALWMEFEQHAERETRLSLLQKISIMFRFNRNALKLFACSPEQVIPYLQNQFYFVKRRELEAEKQELNRKLERYAFDAKMDELTQKSLRLFRAELATRYHWRNNRQCFEKNDFRRNSVEFTREYPVVLSTTYSIKGTLSIEHIYDYLIVDDLEIVVFDVPGQVTIVGLVIAWVLRCDHSQRMNRAGNRHIQHMGIIHKICDDIVDRSQNDCILLPPLKLVDGVHLISISQLLADGCHLIPIWRDNTDALEILLMQPRKHLLPDDHVCNKGEIVRALNCAVEVLSRRKKKPLPENNGKPWTEELDRELSHLFDGGMKKQDLCEHFGRTSGAIESRLERLGKM